ncbi:hypothetical protein FJ366_01475 [Candidatus Dependentiae bacterium]|nr:hypothetical protein [Candidatus Dependentiae bacterium]
MNIFSKLLIISMISVSITSGQAGNCPTRPSSEEHRRLQEAHRNLVEFGRRLEAQAAALAQATGDLAQLTAAAAAAPRRDKIAGSGETADIEEGKEDA